MSNPQEGSMLPIFAALGAIAAILLFLGSFLLSSKAQIPASKANLLIPIPEVPKRILPTPITKLPIIQKEIEPTTGSGSAEEITNPVEENQEPSSPSATGT